MSKHAALWIVLMIGSLPQLAAAAPSRPNIVMIISDDQAWSDYSFMGHPHVQTPHIDRLAAESLTFTRGYVPSSLCCPSLATIITGLYPHQHGITSNDPPNPGRLPAREFHQSDEFAAGREVLSQRLSSLPTLPRVLAREGYVSLQTGKWWQGHFSSGGFTDGMSQGGRHGDQGLSIGRETMQPIYEFVDAAHARQQPFFVWYAPMMPHTPHTPPERLLEKYADSAPSPHIARYWAMIEWFDETVGELLDYLDDHGLADNTIVVYVADNGWITDPATGQFAAKSKQSPYDGGLRTPIIIRWPGQVEPRRLDDLASTIDVAPTLLTAVGISPPPQMQGVNLFDVKARTNRQAIYGECFSHNAVDLARPAASLRWRWMVARDWKIIVPSELNEPQREVELYNLAVDPQEKHNLAPNHPDQVQTLHAILGTWWLGDLAAEPAIVAP